MDDEKLLAARLQRVTTAIESARTNGMHPVLIDSLVWASYYISIGVAPTSAVATWQRVNYPSSQVVPEPATGGNE